MFILKSLSLLIKAKSSDGANKCRNESVFVAIAMGEFARGILSKDIVLFAIAVKVSHLSVELKIFGLLVDNGTNPCAKQFSTKV